MSAEEPDPLARLDASARRAPRRTRVAVGAAIVCFVLAVAVAALLSAGVGGGATAPIGGLTAGAGGAAEGDASNSPAEVSGGGASGSPVLVHVLGSVAKPGLVELTAGARVVDAIAAAGGLLGDADPSGVNLARAVADGEQLVVPKVGEVAPGAGDTPGAEGAGGSSGTGGGGAGDGVVHLNAATLADLDTLPRIGPALAQRILDWRDANGPFTSVDQLREVAGIGDATFAGLVELVAL